MFKITIDNEEVITDKDFTIEEEMLNTPSVILNNVYPKEWEQDKDYLNFYHPNEYSKCKIFNEEITPASEGLTVEGTSFQLTYDDTKKYNLLSLKGDTSQTGTPTPTAPIPVDTVTGRQEISVAGKNLLNNNTFVKGRLDSGNIGYEAGTTDLQTTDNSISFTTNTIYRGVASAFIPVSQNTAYTFTCQVPSNTAFYVDYYKENQTWISRYSTTINGNVSKIITTVANAGFIRISFQLASAGTITISNLMLEKGNQATTYEAYKGHNYELNLGKNLFDSSKYTTTASVQVVSNENNTIQLKGISGYYAGISQNFSVIPNQPYTISYVAEKIDTSVDSSLLFRIRDTGSSTNLASSGSAGSNTLHFTPTTNSIEIYLRVNGATNIGEVKYSNIQLEKGSQATEFAPYKTPIELCKIGNYQDYIFKNTPDSDYYDNTLEEGAWYLHKAINKVTLTGTESWTRTQVSSSNSYAFWSLFTTLDLPKPLYSINAPKICNYFPYEFKVWSQSSVNHLAENSSSSLSLLFNVDNSIATTTAQWNTWLTNHSVKVYYVLDTATTELIEDTELLGQLEEINLLNGLNNISVSSPYLLTPIKIHYNFNEEIINQDLYFCGVVKNSGNISLNPREPHFQSLQVLSYKTFLSEGETLDFVIYQKTIREAIEQVVGAIQDYGFIVGNINILNPDEIIGAYSTKDKSAYDVFQYIADITQSRWTTRMIDEDTIAIDFYDPSLMQLGTTIDYTKEFFSENLIDDMTYSYGTNDYRNKQVMTSQEVYSNITQTQNVIANGYQTQFNVEQQIGKINSIKIGGTNYSFATNTEKEMGVIADFYYSAGNNYFESASTISVGTVIVIDYLPIVEGRQIITNSNEIDRVANSTGVKGVVARYENRNDATTSTELQLIGQSYIKYKGVPEIVLTITTRKDLWNIGQRVQFNAPINELATLYMVRKKSIHRITTIDTIFYTYELVSSFNSETAINYFDNQRAKANGNIGEGEYISRNIDIQSNANIIFYDTQTNEITYTGDNTLNATLDAPFVV